MYTPKQFAVDDTAVVEMLAAGGLAYLVTPGPDGLAVTALPFIYDAARGTLLGHVARANPHWRACAPGVESVAIFSGPDAYISPMFYETTRETGKVAPTWNYETLTVYGEVHVHDDAGWVRANVTALTDRHEAPRAALGGGGCSRRLHRRTTARHRRRRTRDRAVAGQVQDVAEPAGAEPRRCDRGTRVVLVVVGSCRGATDAGDLRVTTHHEPQRHPAATGVNPRLSRSVVPSYSVR